MRPVRELTVRRPRFGADSVVNMMTKTSKTQNRRSMRSSLSLVTVGAVTLSIMLVGCSANGLKTSQGSDSTSPMNLPSPGASASSTPSASAPSRPSQSAPSPAESSSPDSGQGTSDQGASDQGSSSRGSSTKGSPDSSASGPGATGSHDSVSRCRSNRLAVGTRVPDGGGAAGSRYILLTFKNEASSTCFLDGHPGVSFVGKGNGTQLGRPAQRMSSLTKRVLLKPGGGTTALVRIGEADNYDAKQCAPTTADGFRVYPPGSRNSVFVRFKIQACQRSLESGPQMSVSAVGRSH